MVLQSHLPFVKRGSSPPLLSNESSSVPGRQRELARRRDQATTIVRWREMTEQKQNQMHFVKCRGNTTTSMPFLLVA